MEIMRSWLRKQSYREVLRVCVPLSVGMGATMVMEFTDRVFLANYGLDAIAAALPAGILAFLFLAFFSGVGGYCGVFIAQYHGRGMPERIGMVLWQGIYFSLASGLLLFFLALWGSAPIFDLVGHSPEVRRLENSYFALLCGGGVFHVAVITLSSFFAGRGVTRPVMLINILGMVVNIPLDYCLINGLVVFPELGIRGAAFATVICWGVMLLILCLLIFRRENCRHYKLLSAWRFSRQSCLRLCRFGIPGAFQFSLDILAFTYFSIMVGRISDLALATSNIVLSISSLAFMPALGFNQGVSALVGRALGKGRVERARHITWSAIHILLLYTLLFGLLILFRPEVLLNLFLESGLEEHVKTPVVEQGRLLLRIVAVYILLDTFYLIFTGTLKGAGDTGFIMWSSLVCVIFCMVLPLTVGALYFDAGLTFAWSCALFFVFSLFVMSSLRYYQGRWQTIELIEKSGNR